MVAFHFRMMLIPEAIRRHLVLEDIRRRLVLEEIRRHLVLEEIRLALLTQAPSVMRLILIWRWLRMNIKPEMKCKRKRLLILIIPKKL